MKINIKRFVLATLAVFVVYEAIDLLVHMVILGKTYQAMRIWRPDMEQKMWIIYLAVLIFSAVFVYVYSKGYEGKGLIEGLRFGVITWALIKLPGILSQYVIYPVPYKLALKWLGFALIQMAVIGIIVSLIYKPNKK